MSVLPVAPSSSSITPTLPSPPSTPIVHPQASSRFIELLHILPPDLFPNITQCLSLRNKLANLTHVCKAFPSLTPACFIFDPLTFTPFLIRRFTDSPFPPTLLSRVPYAVLVDPDVTSRGAVNALGHLLHPASLVPPFPSLRAVTFGPSWKDGDDQEEEDDEVFIEGEHDDEFAGSPVARLKPLDSPLAGLRLCPHLRVLQLACTLRTADLTILLSMRQLHTLRLQVSLSTEQLLLLVAMPLTTLDMETTSVTCLDAPPSPFATFSPTLRIFLFPHVYNRIESDNDMASLWMRALLASLTTPQEAATLGLERLSVSMNSDDLHGLTRLARLSALQLHVYDDKQGSDELVNFYGSITATPFPHLLHLRVKHKWRSDRGDQPNYLPHASLIALAAVMSTYSGQLHTLELLHSFVAMVAIQPAAASVAATMTAALLSCRSLRRLRIADWWLSTSVRAAASPALPRLESLRVDVVQGIDEPTLAVLLDEAPGLQDLHIRSGSPLPYDVLLWIADRSHELRTLVVEVEEKRFWLMDHSRRSSSVASTMTDTRWDALPPRPALPQLTTAILHSIRTDPKRRSACFSRLVAFLVHSTPALHYCSLLDHWWAGRRSMQPALLGMAQLPKLAVLSLGRGRTVRRWMSRRPEMFWWSRPPKGTVEWYARQGRQRDDMWGEQPLPWPTWLRRNSTNQERMRGGARWVEEVWATCDEQFHRCPRRKWTGDEDAVDDQSDEWSEGGEEEEWEEESELEDNIEWDKMEEGEEEDGEKEKGEEKEGEEWKGEEGDEEGEVDDTKEDDTKENERTEELPASVVVEDEPYASSAPPARPASADPAAEGARKRRRRE